VSNKLERLVELAPPRILSQAARDLLDVLHRTSSPEPPTAQERARAGHERDRATSRRRDPRRAQSAHDSPPRGRSPRVDADPPPAHRTCQARKTQPLHGPARPTTTVLAPTVTSVVWGAYPYPVGACEGTPKVGGLVEHRGRRSGA